MTVVSATEFQYHQDQVGLPGVSVSRSILQTLIQKSPAHARAQHPRLNPEWRPEEKKAFDIGTVCHQLLLDGAAGVQVISYDSWRTNAAKEQAAEARAHDMVPLLEHEWEQVDAMMRAVRPQVGALFENGDTEVTLTWEDHGVLCRARLDWLSPDRTMIRDFKTSSDAEPSKFSKGSFLSYGYDLQDCWYRRAVKACFDVDADYELVVAEKDAPYECIVFDSAPDTLALAHRKLDWALDVWRRCLAEDVWPGYSARKHSVTLPAWAEAQWFDREAREAA